VIHRRDVFTCCIAYNFGLPYTSIHRSSKAATIIDETRPKKPLEIVACNGLAKANAMSNVSKVGAVVGDCFWSPDVGGMAPSDVGCGDVEEASWNLQVVTRFLNKGVEVDAVA
jgi:hypothetical protein